MLRSNYRFFTISDVAVGRSAKPPCDCGIWYSDDGAIESLFTDRLETQEANKFGVNPRDSDVSQQIIKTAQDMKIAPDALVGAFEHAGVTADHFKAHFRDVDVLLIDDVQFLERKARSEEELFHTFNALYDGGSQLVITCDRLPGDLGELEQRLRERFAAGLVTDIESPDLATRLAILRKRAIHDDVAIDPEAVELLADRVTANVPPTPRRHTRHAAHTFDRFDPSRSLRALLDYD